MKQQIEVYDATLRDGCQSLGVTLSLADKLALTQKLDWLGVGYIEGGWPGSNPKDEAYFEQVKQIEVSTAKISAFGSTRRANSDAASDQNLIRLVESRADVTCIFGKSWNLHVTDALRVTLEENLKMIADSVRFLRETTKKPVFFDAEHFFDGFKADAGYAIAAVTAAAEAGAERIILCDTNGGSLPRDIARGVEAVKAALPQSLLGIHVHNDGGLAVANTLLAVETGCIQVQGTMNGVGERCGNVDLTSVIANLELKLGYHCLPEGRLGRLGDVSRSVWEHMNMAGPINQPYVGEAAFAHKGGIHVSAVQRNPRTYEHVPPESVGNVRRILISEMSGRSNVLAKLENRYPQLKDDKVVAEILRDVAARENDGYSYEAADGSFDLLVRRHIGAWRPAFEFDYYRVHGIGTAGSGADHVEATVKLRVNGEQRLCVEEGNGPVDALSRVLRQALTPAFPSLAALQLTDYKVRVVNSADGTSARVRVLVQFHYDHHDFGTIGVHENVIEASWRALVEAIEYVVLHEEGQKSAKAASSA
jgi:2-isopropylmalate synthase